MTIIGRITGTVTREPKAWAHPQFEAPYLIDARELDPLGQVGVHVWWSHKLGELRERPETLTDDDVLPNRVIVQATAAGERSYRVFDLLEPGSFAIAAAGPMPRESRPIQLRPIDALDGVRTLIRGDGTKVRGCQAIHERYAAKGYVLSAAFAPDALNVDSDRGRFGTITRGEIDTLKPLMVPFYRNGRPPGCTRRDHGEGGQPEAVTPGLGGVLVCQACLDGVA